MVSATEKVKESRAEELGVMAQEESGARRWTLKQRMDGGEGGQGKAVSGSGSGSGVRWVRGGSREAGGAGLEGALEGLDGVGFLGPLQFGFYSQ